MRSANASIIVVLVLTGCCWFRIGPVAPPPPVAQGNGNLPEPQPQVKPPDQQAMQPPRRILGDKYVYIQQCLRDRRTTDEFKGFKTNKAYRDVPQEGAILVGFKVGYRKFFDKDIIAAVCPIYLTRNGDKEGAWVGKPPSAPIVVKANPGYCVGGLNVRTGLGVDGFSVIFMKIDNDRLNPDDNYTSNWMGSNGGGPSTVGGSGVLAIGICGHVNNEGAPCSFGLVAANLSN
jgi:hypothetical protein